MFLETDLTELPLPVRTRMKEILTTENARAALAAKIRQKRIAQFYHNHQPRSIEGLGGQKLAMDPYWVNYFRLLLGPGTVDRDEEFKDWVFKRHPCFRVKSGGTRLQFASAAIPGSARRTFRKTYEEAKT